MLDEYDYVLRNFLKNKEVQIECGEEILVWVFITFPDLEEIFCLLEEYDINEIKSSCAIRKGYIALKLNGLIDIHGWDYEFIKLFLPEHDATYYERELRKEFG